VTSTCCGHRSLRSRTQPSRLILSRMAPAKGKDGQLLCAQKALTMFLSSRSSRSMALRQELICCEDRSPSDKVYEPHRGAAALRQRARGMGCRQGPADGQVLLQGRAVLPLRRSRPPLPLADDRRSAHAAWHSTPVERIRGLAGRGPQEWRRRRWWRHIGVIVGGRAEDDEGRLGGRRGNFRGVSRAAARTGHGGGSTVTLPP
jgi:hypothetical protein